MSTQWQCKIARALTPQSLWYGVQAGDARVATWTLPFLDRDTSSVQMCDF